MEGAAHWRAVLMSTEIEVKVLEIEPARIISKIEQLGGVQAGNWLIRTQVYDFPDRRLLSQGSYIRVRNEGSIWHWTYKRKISQSAKCMEAKTMEELDVEASDPETVHHILQALGLEVVLYFEKKRQHYKNGSVIFDVDELPTIPPFLEIEAPSLQEIHDALEKLGIPPQKALSLGPKELLAFYGIDLDKIKELRFSVS
jgi:adenylate cyclase class 2